MAHTRAHPDRSRSSKSVHGTSKHRRALQITFALTFFYFLVEVIAGIVTNSLALLADAAHMLTDVGGLALALFASWMSQKPATTSKTFGYYRLEILAALANAAVLVVMSIVILFEAFRRLEAPPEVEGVPMMVVAGLGLLVNLIGVWNLREGAKESVNVQGAFLEVLSDTLGSIGVIVAGGIVYFTGWNYADPLFGVLIGLFILPRTWKMLSHVVNVLLEGVPAHIEIATVEKAMLRVPGIAKIHDLHIWTLTSGMEVLSAHVVLEPGIEQEYASKVLEKVTAILEEEFRINHTTIQIEHVDRSKQEEGH